MGGSVNLKSPTFVFLILSWISEQRSYHCWNTKQIITVNCLMQRLFPKCNFLFHGCENYFVNAIRLLCGQTVLICIRILHIYWSLGGAGRFLTTFPLESKWVGYTSGLSNLPKSLIIAWDMGIWYFRVDLVLFPNCLHLP